MHSVLRIAQNTGTLLKIHLQESTILPHNRVTKDLDHIDDSILFDISIMKSILQDLDSGSQLKIRDQFILDLKNDETALGLALEENHYVQISEVAHRLKTLCGTFGLMPIAHATDIMSAVSKNNNNEAISVCGHWIHNKLILAIQEVERHSQLTKDRNE